MVRKVLFLLVVLSIVGFAQDRTYHSLPISKVAKTSWTHIEVSGRVDAVIPELDGDYHVWLSDGQARCPEEGSKHCLTVEIIPTLRLTPPKVGQMVSVRGIFRWDKRHDWPEIHPAESIGEVRAAEPAPSSTTK